MFNGPTRVLAAVLSLGLLASPALAAPGGRTMTVKDLLAVKWLGQVNLSPDGTRAAFVIRRADWKANRFKGHIWMVSTTRSPGHLQQLTASTAGESQPAFSPDGKQLAFVSARQGGRPQIFVLPMQGGEARQLTHLSTGASGPVWSPDGKTIVFVSSVFPACKGTPGAADACNKARLARRKKSKVKAMVIDHLLYRHWSHWRRGRVSHVFVAPADGSAPARDMTPGPHDAPPEALGGDQDYEISPDGKTLAYVTNTDAVLAVSTNNDLFVVPLKGKGKARRVSTSKGNDNSPRFSPDGRWLAYLSMARAGYESDRPRIMVRDLHSGKETEWTRGYAGRPYELRWGPDSATLYFTAPHQGQREVFAATASGVSQVTHGMFVKDLNLSPDGRRLVVSDEAANRAPEVHTVGTDGKGDRALTTLNAWLTRDRHLEPAEHHWFTGAKGEKVHAILVKPPGFKKGHKYPAMLMIHGGPQGMTGNSFHPRWNLQMFAARGYVIFGINFHGSVGFGQAFTDSIRGDWGGKPYQDILKGTEYLARLPFVRGNKICAAGASYGGYMVNWLATHTRRYKCLISHAGLYNVESEYGATEELWFPEWDFKGLPWTNREAYRKVSPHSYAENIKTPTLVIHGQQDFRVPVEQGFQMFTALQRQGVPSRLLYFPDENHFVKKPQNIALWWHTMHDWLARYLKK